LIYGVFKNYSDGTYDGMSTANNIIVGGVILLIFWIISLAL